MKKFVVKCVRCKKQYKIEGLDKAKILCPQCDVKETLIIYQAI